VPDEKDDRCRRDRWCARGKERSEGNWKGKKDSASVHAF
jgi:hypothetical protein